MKRELNVVKTSPGLQHGIYMNQFHSQKLRQTTEKIIGLPTLPTIVTQLITLVGDPSSSARQVSQLISTDQALTAKILKVANSAFYGFPRKISTVQLAIVVLGFETVKNLSLSAAVLKRFSTGTELALFDRQRFWDHTIGCGVAGKMLARKLGYQIEGEAFVAGVLHDIGKLILIEYFPKKFSNALDLAQKETLTISDAEEQIFGVTHAELGAWLAEKWNLPNSLVETIAYHHRPCEQENPEDLVLLIHLANALIRHFKIGNSGDQQKAYLNPKAAEKIKRGENISDVDFFNRLGQGLKAELEKAQIFKELNKD